MNIGGKLTIEEKKNKGAYLISMELGKVNVKMTAFFTNKVSEKEIKKIDEGDTIHFTGFTSIRKSTYNGYDNYDTILNITAIDKE